MSDDNFSLIIKGGDLLMVLLGGGLAYGWRFGAENFPLPPSYSMLMSTGALLLVFVFNSLGVYRSWRGGNLVSMLGRVLTGWTITILILLSLLFFLKASDNFSRIWLLAWAALTAILLVLGRLILYLTLRWMRLHGKNHKRVILVGQSEVAQELLQRVGSATWTGFDVVAVFDDQCCKTPSDGLPLVCHNLGEIESYLETHPVDEVWITLPLKDEDRLRELLFKLRHSTANIRYVPGLFAFRLLNHGVSEIVGIPMLNLSTTPMTGLNRWLKAMEDRILALIFLIFASPLMLIIAVAVKLSSPGPVLFKQQRFGWDGKPFTIYKFRTMVVHTEPSGCLTQARRDDPRVTPIGAYLRRTSLDELPQLINVLQGRMSIVGPRPHAIEHHEKFKHLVDDYMQRHKVKPGITGWAQVNGYRGETDTLEKIQKRVEYDLYYIEHWSLLFDLRIIALTMIEVFAHKNAY